MNRQYSSEFSAPAESIPQYVTTGQGCVIVFLVMLVIFTAAFVQDSTDKHIKVLENRIDALEQRLKDFE